MSGLVHSPALGPKSTSPRFFAGSLTEDGLTIVCMHNPFGRPGLDSDHPGTSPETFVAFSSVCDVSLTVTRLRTAGLGQGWGRTVKGGLSVWIVWQGLGGLLAEEINDFDDAF